MIREPLIPLFDLVLCVSDAVDLVSPDVAQHHKQVAYIAQAIAHEMGVTHGTRHEIVLAGMLHDIGALSLKERLDLLQFETQNPHRHAEIASRLLFSFPRLRKAGELVRFHHLPWDEGRGEEFHGLPVPLESHIIHLADRVAVSIDRRQGILVQAPNICKRIAAQRGRLFSPAVVDAFLAAAERECFWLDATSPSLTPALRETVAMDSIELGPDEILAATNLFRQIIDFRSRFTARHSAGVAAVAEALAALFGFSARELRLMRVAGYLHDLGKLAVPAEILEKPGRLTDEEYSIMRAHTFHTYYTYRTLRSVHGMAVVSAWAAFHHERLDGSGYPFHLKAADLPLGSRIMAVADTFTALTEDRPYRNGMDVDRAFSILMEMAEKRALDREIVALARGHLGKINDARATAQADATEEYRRLFAELDTAPSP